MEYVLKGLFGERSLTKVVGVFTTRAQADAAALEVQKAPGMAAWQSRVLGPQDSKISRHNLFARSMEPEQRGMFRTLVMAHSVTGFAGAVAGGAVFVWLFNSGIGMVVGSPWMALFPMIFFGAVFGLLLGGLISLRPDHVWLISAVRSALEKNQWVLIVHPTDADQTAVVKQTLSLRGANILKSL